MRPMEIVKIRLGFWKGCHAAIIDKIPLLPIYKVYVERPWDDDYRHIVTKNILNLDCPWTYWVFGFQLQRVEKPTWHQQLDIAKECIRYLAKHRSVALNMSDPSVAQAMNNVLPLTKETEE